MEISHSRGGGAVGGHWGAAGIGSLWYHWRLSLDTNLLLIPQLFKGLEFIPIRLRFYSRSPQKTWHQTPPPPPTGPCCAGRGPGKYLPSKAPVYPSGAVTSGWTPFNIYPRGFHRSAAQARQTLLIKTGACFKEPLSGRQSALAGQKSPDHVAAGKPELPRLHFPSTSFSTKHCPQFLNSGRTPVQH